MSTIERDFLLAHASFCNGGCSECQLATEEEQYEMSLFRIAILEAEASQTLMRRFPDVCVYCGDCSADRDHLLPEPWTGKAVRLLTPTVPACSCCNTLLGEIVEPRIEQRALIVHTTLETRNRKLIERMGKVDLEELEGNLRHRIEARRNKGNHILARLRVLSVGGFAQLDEEDRLAILYDGLGEL